MSTEELEIVAKELEKEILDKLNQIKENVLTKSIPDAFQRIEILAMVSDELSDVILNWDPRVIDNDLGDDLL
jgi:hypothetical protein